MRMRQSSLFFAEEFGAHVPVGWEQMLKMMISTQSKICGDSFILFHEFIIHHWQIICFDFAEKKKITIKKGHLISRWALKADTSN